MKGDHVEHRPQIETCRTHGVEHLGHRNLAFERCIEFVEEPGVRNRDRGLVSKRLQNLSRSLVEWTHLFATDDERADEFSIEDQCDIHHASNVVDANEFINLWDAIASDHRVVGEHRRVLGNRSF